MSDKSSIDLMLFMVQQKPPEVSLDFILKGIGNIAGQMENNSVHGKKFKSREKGEIGETQKYINKLVEDNPALKAKELMRLADKNIIGDMKDGNFGNKVTIARKNKLIFTV